jgi:hypothetical protein
MVVSGAAWADSAENSAANQVPGPAPTQASVWMAGHWNSEGGQWKWVAAHWEVPPSPSATWVEGHWVPSGASWVWANGAWNVGQVAQSPTNPPQPPGQPGADGTVSVAPGAQGMPVPSTPAPYVTNQYPGGQATVVTDYGPDYYASDDYYPGYYWNGNAWLLGGYPGFYGFGFGLGPVFYGGYGRGGYGHFGHGGFGHGASGHFGGGGHSR